MSHVIVFFAITFCFYHMDAQMRKQHISFPSLQIHLWSMFITLFLILEKQSFIHLDLNLRFALFIHFTRFPGALKLTKS